MARVLLTSAEVPSLLDRVAKPLEKYLWLQENSKSSTLSEEFQKTYKGYYRVQRRSAEWYRSYFALLVQLRDQPCDFGYVLANLKAATGRVEASFASKLVATINPNLPVIDRVVLQNLKLKLPYPHENNRLEKIEIIYSKLFEELSDFIASPEGFDAIKMFRGRFMTASVTDIKIIDLLLWQKR